MEILPLLENSLFAIGQLLRLPIMVLLWVCVVGSLFSLGHCFSDFLRRQRERSRFELNRWAQNTTSIHQASINELSQLPSELRHFVTSLNRSDNDTSLTQHQLTLLLLSAEDKVRSSLTLTRLLIKTGPSLGLIGTLIPMGSSMAAMASGQLEAMAGQMVVAFTSTIVGIACGTLAFFIFLVRQQWQTTAIREQRYLADLVRQELEDSKIE